MRITRYHREEVCVELGNILSTGDETRIKKSLHISALNYSKTNPRLSEIFKKQKSLLFGD